ncbi:Na+/H+ antiporter subunit E [Mesorhizobium sp. YIM 152430]|jgi:multicomponent Na+:H+ antiporter subunit E|uniref:Na+/H+ antiporter subunit E n=1 Tax=Mesorhizobium sp. YIM 152430 TaxID=3031761 RepID=UPI0023DCE68F|nr:Na+/H+ antiporter subunit E [Mesorhizobium sp. YIM 152430]MDF1601296.1 Na+/H+ antiporter subunit E [Mesorhizobium sp. YIM 152430]
MTLLLVNVLLALAWGGVTGSFTLLNLVFGFILGAGALYLIRKEIGSLGYLARMRRVVSLMVLFLVELVKSSWTVALTVLSPKMDIKPGMFVYPLKVDKDAEITMLANLITLTPGTLSVDVSEDRRFLFIHALDCSDPDQLRHDIATGFERKIMEAFR